MPDERSLSGFLAVLRAELAQIPGLSRAYQHVPESINERISILAYPVSGNYRLDTHGTSESIATLLGIHTVRIELRLPRKDLPQDMELVEAFTDIVPAHVFHAFASNRFEQTLVTTGDPDTAQNTFGVFRYRIVEDQYGSDQQIGHQIDFDVAIQQEISYA